MPVHRLMQTLTDQGMTAHADGGYRGSRQGDADPPICPPTTCCVGSAVWDYDPGAQVAPAAEILKSLGWTGISSG